MPISSRFVVSSSMILLAIGFLTLPGIVGSAAWLSEKSNSYFEGSARSRALRVSVELLSFGSHFKHCGAVALAGHSAGLLRILTDNVSR